jgi:hypothetical protein
MLVCAILLLAKPNLAPYCLQSASRVESTIGSGGRKIIDTYRATRDNDRVIIHLDHGSTFGRSVPGTYHVGDQLSVLVDVTGTEFTVYENQVKLIR